jgi:hypothetical protein
MAEGNGLINVMKKISSILSDENVPFCLAGGLAVSILSRPRATEDIDFLVLLDRKKLSRVNEALSSHFKIASVHEHAMRMKNISIERTVIVDPDSPDNVILIDFLLADDDIYRNAIKRASVIHVDDCAIPVPAPEDMILIKTLSGRPQDLLDVESLREANRGNLDEEYINKNLGKIK